MKKQYALTIVNNHFETVHKIIHRKEALHTFRQLLNGIDEDRIISFRVRKRLTKVKEK